MLQDFKIKGRKDVGQAERTGAVAAAGGLEHADDVLTDVIRHI
jgi:hypothetical protein